MMHGYAPSPSGHADIGTAIHHTAGTGTNIVLYGLIIMAALIVIGAILLAVAHDEARRDS